jgi:hypothetical protein
MLMKVALLHSLIFKTTKLSKKDNIINKFAKTKQKSNYAWKEFFLKNVNTKKIQKTKKLP